MKTNIIFCLALILCGAFGGGCASGPAETGERYPEKIHMLDAKNGWMAITEGKGFQVLHTTDGGRRWKDVTPQPFPYRHWDCEFPKANMAWVSFYEKNKTCLLLTTNAGKSWEPWQPLGAFDNSTDNYFLGGERDDCRFFNPNDGQVIMFDGGTCQAEYTFFETHDGGLSWNFAPFFQRSSSTHGTIQIGDCDGSATSYYPPGTVVIAQGDLMDETPKGIVRLSLTSDAGKAWRDVTMPLPAQFQDRLVESSPPYFFDASNALMAVSAMRDATNGFVDPMLVMYATRDGGNTWSARPGIFSVKGFSYGDCDYVTLKDIYLKSDAGLYATHDGAKSWQMARVNAAFESIGQVDFTDAAHGWLVVFNEDPRYNRDYYPFHLYRTSNGGKSWSEMPVKISR